MRGPNRIKLISRSIRRKIVPGALILCYHRVINLDSDPYELCVTPEHFSAHLEYINEAYTPVSLLDLVDFLANASLPDRAVAITFDDGYQDNFSQAYPLLKSARIPATFFITAENVDSKQEFWWDDLERVFLTSSKLPESLTISIDGSQYNWKISSLEQREPIRQDVYQLLFTLNYGERQKIIEQLVSWAGLEEDGREDFIPMNSQELLHLNKDYLMEIGAHTANHPSLANISPREQYQEITSGRQKVESIIGQQVFAFAYPYGRPSDFTSASVDIVKESGFKAACTTINGSIEIGHDPLTLNRCEVHDWNVTEFKQNLERCFIC